MRKLLPLLVVGILVLSGLGAGAFFKNKQSSQNRSEELDQYQEIMTENTLIPIGNIPIPDNPICVQVAQSFIPTKEVLTKIELYIIKNSTATYPLKVSIREELTNEDLTYIDIDPSLVPTESFEWIEINFDDIVITTGLTYYIVTLTENITDNFYGWGANNISESYPLGCAWISLDEGDTWTNESVPSYQNSVDSKINQNPNPRFDDTVTWDMCFKTYGRNNQAPPAPSIDGPNKGKPGVEYSYTFVTDDPDGDDVYYWILWGDGCPAVEWIGPYASGEVVTVKHTFTKKGTYTIGAKAKDTVGAEGEWGYLEVSIPRNYVIRNSLLLKLMEKFPHAFPVLRYMLGL